MTHLSEFTAMLDHAGHKYEVKTGQEHIWWDGYGKNRKRVCLENVIMVVAEGTFYEQLYAYFENEGSLIEMVSHVAYGGGSTPRARELLKEQSI